MNKALKIVVAFLLGIVSYLLILILVFLAQGIPFPGGIPLGIVILAMCAYFFISAYLLSRRSSQPALEHWPISLALSPTLIVMPVTVRTDGWPKGDVIATAGMAVPTVAVSWAGAATAGQVALHRSQGLAGPALRRTPGSASVSKSDISGPAPLS